MTHLVVQNGDAFLTEAPVRYITNLFGEVDLVKELEEEEAAASKLPHRQVVPPPPKLPTQYRWIVLELDDWQGVYDGHTGELVEQHHRVISQDTVCFMEKHNIILHPLSIKWLYVDEPFYAFMPDESHLPDHLSKCGALLIGVDL